MTLTEEEKAEIERSSGTADIDIEDIQAKRISDFLKVQINSLCTHSTKEKQQRAHAVAGTLRRFLLRLAWSDYGYCYPLWIGLVAIDDDCTLMNMCMPLILYMWT